MNVPESWAIEAAKAAMPFADAQKLAESYAQDAVRQLEKFNQTYTAQNTWFDDGSYFKFSPMDNAEIDRAVAMLSRYFLLLLHRRGLVGF
jgi:hypothetical protein